MKYQRLLGELSENRKDAMVFIQNMKKKAQTSFIRINITQDQLVALIYVTFENLVLSNPYTQKEIVQFFQTYFIQSGGELYRNIETVFSKFKNGSVNPKSALTEVISKLVKKYRIDKIFNLYV